MQRIKVDFSENLGKIKPMHATNNGPYFTLKNYNENKLHRINSNLDLFKAAGIPFARTHDSSTRSAYGMDHTVDLHMIFPNFDADPYDPTNYDFTCTDHYMECIELAGTEIFYRLGAKIEHEVKKYATLPPRDYMKWAIIAEHIIRHYTEGWADGYKKNIRYWEIWNEPDLNWDWPESYRPTWGGTKQEFFDFYHVVATHLKNCFPHLKIGGPAISHDVEWADEFLAQLKAPLDFFSWHCYCHEPEAMIKRANKIDALLKKHGFPNAESILNEWNYMISFHGDECETSLLTHFKLKGTAFVLACMLISQDSPIDMLMYYDARPYCSYCGMFHHIVVGQALKGYYPFPAFNTLYRLGNEVKTEVTENNIYAVSAKGEDGYATLFTYFDDNDGAEDREITLSFTGLDSEKSYRADFYALDEKYDLEKVFSEKIEKGEGSKTLRMQNFSSYLVKIEEI